MRASWSIAILLPLLTASVAHAADPYVGHGYAMHGDLKYGRDFKAFEYSEPNAPKGGSVRYGVIGTSFDSFNPFVLRAIPAAGLGNLFDTLMEGSSDEAFSRYGRVAETIEVPQDRSWVAFILNPKARFHDGSPMTVEDVIWTFEALKTKGHPRYRAYYQNVTKAEKVGERKVKFTFEPGENRELPLIVSELPVLSKAYWGARDFEKTTLEPPLGSGPYKIESFEPGRSITYRRVADYWAKDLPVNQGQDNPDLVRYDYYRDSTVAVEAFKSGEYDMRLENTARIWATGYDSPAFRAGLYKLEEIKHELPTGMQAFVFNTRRPIFADRRVRQALGFAFDFEWSNKTLFHGAYTRTASYFSNSELASSGLPKGEELKILEKYRGRVPPEVFTQEFQPPHYDGSGNIREGLREALRLLKEAGWEVKDQRLVQTQNGQRMEFEILLTSPDFERVVQPFARNLERLGVQAKIRVVDSAQYQNREDDFDFDLIVDSWGQSLSPGNEQRDFWSSSQVAVKGSRNTAGIKDPVVDELIDLVIAAPDRESLIQRTRALDRVLLAGHYVIPHWHSRVFRVAYWDKFGRPKINPKYGFGGSYWWIDPEKLAAIETRRRAMRN
jgi:microcin C transport system substrate-binding protein